jgi:hypothetical protein
MNEKKFSNKFKFSLYQQDVLLCEKMFDADQFNPFTRSSIDIREILPRATVKLQKVLSKRSYETCVDVGFSNTDDVNSLESSYELFQYHQKMVNLYPQGYRNDMKYNPEPIVQQIVNDFTLEEKTIKGVECKIGFYINDKTIVERVFYVDGFNPIARWSLDVVYIVDEIVEMIFNNIKKTDVKNIWDDYDLIKKMGLSFNEIKLLPASERDMLLRRIKDN